jgi:hypothetical protein
MRGRRPFIWALAIAAGVLVLLVVSAALADDDSGQTVSNGEWAQSVCGAVATWQGELEAIVEDIRTPPAFGSLGVEEPQSETEQGRTGFVRAGLERAIQATDTMVEGIERAGSPQSEEASKAVSEWADKAHDDLEDAQDSLDEEADSIRESVEQVAGATRSLAAVFASGVETLADVARADPQLAAAVRDSSTCQALRAES